MKRAAPIFPHECYKCGLCDESKFVNAGPHIKQVCNGCGFYVKFFDKSKLPDVKEIKLKIWYMTEGDVKVIEQQKIECEFIEGLTGLFAKLIYWNLYLRIRLVVDVTTR